MFILTPQILAIAWDCELYRRMGPVGCTVASLGGVRPGVAVVLQWCLGGWFIGCFLDLVLVVSWWFVGGASVVSQWSVMSWSCFGGVSLVSFRSLGNFSLVSRSSVAGILVASLLMDSCRSLAGLLLDSCWSLAGLLVVFCRRHGRVLLSCIEFIDGYFFLFLFHMQRCETAMFSPITIA